MNTAKFHHRKKTIIAAGILLSVLGFAGNTSALAAESISREQAIEAALDKTGGASKVLSVEKITKSDAEFFAVKLMVNGRVKVVRIPAER